MPPTNNTKRTVIIVILSVLLVAAVAFGAWAFSSRQDYKDKSDKKAAAAASVASTAAKNDQKAKDDEAAKQPYKTYSGSLTYGGVTFDYPKTWSGLVDTTDSTEPINGNFYPDILPALDSKTAMALRVELLNQDYANVLSEFDSNIQSGGLKSTAYVPPKLANTPNVQPGVRLDGAITSDFNGSMVVIKVRDKTLEISTQSNDFISDFNNVVLPNLTFVP